MGASTVTKPCPVCGHRARRDMAAKSWSCGTCKVTWPVGRRHPLLSSTRSRSAPVRARGSSSARRRRSGGGETFATVFYLLAFGVPIGLGLLWAVSMIVSPPERDPAEQAALARAEHSRQVRDEREAEASASPEVLWEYELTECADGWQSPSIGERGACSWHGGVVSVYQGSDGTTLECADGSPPYGKDEQVEQITSDRWSGHFWCD